MRNDFKNIIEIYFFTFINIVVCILLLGCYKERTKNIHDKNIVYMTETFAGTSKQDVLSFDEFSFKENFCIKIFPISESKFYCIYNSVVIKLFNTDTFIKNIFSSKNSRIETRLLMVIAKQIKYCNMKPITIEVLDNKVYINGNYNKHIDAEIFRIACNNKLYGNIIQE